MKVGQILEAARHNRELTLKEFSKKYNVDAVLISKIERNKIEASDEILTELATYYQVDVNSLLKADRAIEVTDPSDLSNLPAFLPPNITDDQLKRLLRVIKNS